VRSKRGINNNNNNNNNNIALGYGLDDGGFESPQGMGIFLLTTASRPALEPTQSNPIEYV
jgi:hypothetical protein